MCSFSGDTNTILERSINLILEGPKAFFNFYPQPKIQLPHHTVLGKQLACTGSNPGSFPLPVSFTYALWLHLAQHSSAIHV